MSKGEKGGHGSSGRQPAVVTDIIGVAVTVGNEEDFHAKASKKIKGA